MSRANPVGIFLWTIAALNLSALLLFFVYPRFKFMAAHADMTPAQLTETPGPPDLPNPSVDVFVTANRLAELTPPAAAIFMPPHKGAHRSAALQRLYPRKVYWADVEENEYKKNIKAAPGVPESFLVGDSQWGREYCPDQPRIPLPGTDRWLCRLDR